MELRDYQKRSLDMLYDWFEKNPAGNPCLNLPTGAGKSILIASFCHGALLAWPDTRILMLTHQRELIAQNAEKLRQHWPGAPLGIYSAGLNRKTLGEPITFAGVQSVRNLAAGLGHIDIVLVDEAHMISHKDGGGYRKLLDDLKGINPNMRVVGLTATPYRLGHGLITDKPGIFDDLIEPVTIEELIHKGYLSPLRSKVTGHLLDVSGVKKRGGEYIDAELQAAVDTDANNIRVVEETLARSEGRKAMLFFCAGVKHAKAIAALLTARGVPAGCVTGSMSTAQRDEILNDFKAGKLRAVTNCSVLTTGFDYPGIDLIAMCRPTMSTALYVQMAGRGLRIAVGKEDCLVLDFAGVVVQHGPITCVNPPARKGQKVGRAPTKTCPGCGEVVHASVRTCPGCSHQFPAPEPQKLFLREDIDIMGREERNGFAVAKWKWQEHVSKASGIGTLKATYYPTSPSRKPVDEYLNVLHPGYAGRIAQATLYNIASESGADMPKEKITDANLDEIAARMTASKAPSSIKTKVDGNYKRVTSRKWEQMSLISDENDKRNNPFDDGDLI